MVASQSDSRADAMVDAVGDIGRALDRAEPQELLELYASLRLRLVFDPASRLVNVSVQPLGQVNSACPRGDLNPRPSPCSQVQAGT